MVTVCEGAPGTIIGAAVAAHDVDGRVLSFSISQSALGSDKVTIASTTGAYTVFDFVFASVCVFSGCCHFVYRQYHMFSPFALVLIRALQGLACRESVLFVRAFGPCHMEKSYDLIGTDVKYSSNFCVTGIMASLVQFDFETLPQVSSDASRCH